MKKYVLFSVLLLLAAWFIVSGSSCPPVIEEATTTTATVTTTTTTTAATTTTTTTTITTTTATVSAFGCGGGANTGTVSGTVTDFYTGAAISNVAVLVGTQETTTDSSGNYSVSNVSAGTVEVSVAKSGYGVITMKVNAATVNFMLIPTAYAKGSLHGSLKNAAGDLVSGMVNISNGKKTAYASYQGTGYYFCNSAPVGDLIVTLDKGGSGTATTAAYATVTLAEGGSEEANLAYAAPAQCGTLAGSINMPSGYFGPLACNYIINKNPGIFNLLQGICYLGYADVSGSSYSLSHPATGDDRVFATFALGVVTGESLCTPEGYSIGVSLASVNAGENKTHDFDLPEILTSTAPADQASGVGTTPTFSWSCPWSSGATGYVVVLSGGGSSGLAWLGFSNDNSITYPSFSGTVGNLQSGTTYQWYPVAGKIAGVSSLNSIDFTNFPIESFSSGKTRSFTP